MRVFDTESCIVKFISVHGDKYNYSKVDYINSKVKVSILCNIHNQLFSQEPNSHISGRGCPMCKQDKRRMSLSSFLEKANLIHDNFYLYNFNIIKNVREKVLIYCPSHGDFVQRISNHLYGDGCPSCSKSKGEMEIERLLKERGISYISQYSFKDCKYKNLLRFDFYLPDHRSIIEYDGRQHYMPIFGIDKLKDTKIKDEIKNNYCIINEVRLLRVSYIDNIKDKIDELFASIL